MRRFDNPAAFLAGIALRTLTSPRPTIAAPAVTDDTAKRLQKDHKLTGKRIGGHLCIVATPK